MKQIDVREGPRLLAGYDEGPGLTPHRARYGNLPDLDATTLVRLARQWDIRGRGGAGFPFAIKLEGVAGKRRPVLVVNMSEGEPAAHKDAALALGRPHLVLDGAAVVARALGATLVHLVVPGENPRVIRAVRAAVAERPDSRLFTIHEAADRFVAGQARAVLELMAGRPNLPVTAWQPEVFDGHRGRPTLLSNAETWAQVAVRVLRYDEDAPETTLLTWDGETSPMVAEVVEGTPWREVVPLEGPVLIGGYHGAWATPRMLAGLAVDRDRMKQSGVPIGAGAVIPLGPGECPVTMTARITAYLAGQSARRCGPCFNGLPALADAVAAVAWERGGVARVEHLQRMVSGRGACTHPDGTARMVGSMLSTFPEDVEAHARGECTFTVAAQRERELVAR
jgi:NADH:ubiquinone oxidoreductase subunit F (NADH-binding)